MSLMIYPHFFDNGDFVSRIMRVIHASSVDPAKIEISISEAFAATGDEIAIVKLHELRSHGIKLGIANFGSHNASLHALSRLPLDVVRLDRSFTDALCADETDKKMPMVAINACRTMGIPVRASGLETEQHVATMLSAGCETGQGSYFGKPASAADFPGLYID